MKSRNHLMPSGSRPSVGSSSSRTLGFGQQRLGEGEALAHAVAVGADFRVDALGQADAVDDLARGLRIEAAGVAHEDSAGFPSR